MNQELVILPSGPPPAVYGGVVNYYDETGLNDVARLKPHNIILVQNTTRDGKTARPGQLLDTLTEEVYDRITVVPLKVMRQRVLFPPNSDEAGLDADPICRSNDGIVPSPRARAPQSVTCKRCPMSVWAGGKKAPCAEKIKLLVVTKDTGLPRFFTASGKSIPTLRALLDRINENVFVHNSGCAKDPTKRPLNLFDFSFTISSDVVNGKFKYYVARFDNVLRVANIGDFGELFTQFVTQRKVEELEEAAAVTEATADAAVSEMVDAQFVSEV